jgi:hypothetical protein
MGLDDEAAVRLLGYERAEALRNASAPGIRWVKTFQEVGAMLALAGVREGVSMQLSRCDFDSLSLEVAHISRTYLELPVRPASDRCVYVETPCGTITATIKASECPDWLLR